MNLLSCQEQVQQYFADVKNDESIKKTLKKIPTKWRHFFCEPLQCSPLLKYLT